MNYEKNLGYVWNWCCFWSFLGLLGKGSYTYLTLNGTALKQIKNHTSDFTNAHLINKFHSFNDLIFREDIPTIF